MQLTFRTLAAFALALACAVSSAQAATLTATPASLAAAVAQAKSGDTIYVGDGPPADLTVRNKVFAPAITITPALGAHPTLSSVQLASVTGVHFLAIETHQTKALSQASPAVFFQASHDVAYVGGKVSGSRDPTSGYWLGKGISLLASDGVFITDDEVTGFFKGISLADVHGTVARNHVHVIRTSPIDGGGDISGMVIADNIIDEIVPVAGADHSDGIHFQLKSGKTVDGLTITGNRMTLAAADGTLGINLQGTSDACFTNVKVNNNTLRWNNNQALTTNFVCSGEFKANVLRAAPGLDNAAHCCGIVMRAYDAAHVVIEGNTTKDSPSMKPFRNNTFLTAAQISADGAKP